MRKKGIFGILLLMMSYMCNVTTVFIHATQSKGYTVSSQYIPKATMVIDADKGRILYAENSDRVVDVASITKLMTAYLVYEAIKNGQITMNTTVVATKTDEAISQIKGLANTKIVSGQSYRVQDLLKMQLLASSNVASIMLAKLLSNSQLSQFVSKMNAKAKEWQMTHTTFTHPTGASSSLFNGLSNVASISNTAQNQSSARDVLIMSYHLLKDFPDILSLTKQATATVGKETFTTTNYSLPSQKFGLQGVDGLKTGSSGVDGYSYVFTMSKNNFRIIGVVLGVGTYNDERAKDNRHIIGNAIADYVYNNYSIQPIIQAGTFRVDNSEVTFQQPFNNLVGPNQNWSYKLENNSIILNETLQSIIAPTSYQLPKDSTIIQNKGRLGLTKPVIFIGSVVILFILMCLIYISVKKGRRK